MSKKKAHRWPTTPLTAIIEEHGYPIDDWWLTAPKQLRDPETIAKVAGVERWSKALPYPPEMFAAAMPRIFLPSSNRRGTKEFQGLRARVCRLMHQERPSGAYCAERIGVSQQSISNHEKGRKCLLAERQRLLAQVLGVDGGYLLEGVKSNYNERKDRRKSILADDDPMDEPENCPPFLIDWFLYIRKNRPPEIDR